MRFLFKICFYRYSTSINIADHQHFFDRNWLSWDKAWTEIYNVWAKLNSRLSSFSNKKEIIFRSTDYLKLKFVILKFMLSYWQICNFKFNFLSFWDTSSLRIYCDILVYLSFPNKIKIKLSTVQQNNFLWLPFIYKEFSKIKLVWISCFNFNSVVSIYWMMNFISFSFNIEN